MVKYAHLFFILLLFSCSGYKNQESVKVFAAASLSDVLEEIKDSFKADVGITVKLNCAGSGTLARQIEQGAAADVYITANKKWKDYLTDKSFSLESSVFAKNELVLVSSGQNKYEIMDVKQFLEKTKERIAVGDPGYVPAGEYALQVFKSLNIDMANKLINTVDVRAALMMVEMGEAGLGIVYKTDALLSDKVEIVHVFSQESHDVINYFRMRISEKEAAQKFYNYLYSSEAKEILSKYSFKTD